MESPLFIHGGLEPMNHAQLAQMSKPAAGALDVTRQIFFDSQQYPAAGVGRLEFFASVPTDRTLGNLRTAPQLPAGEFFRVEALALDFLAAATATAAVTEAGILNDINRILNVARGTFAFNMGNRSTPPMPLAALGSLGGIDPAGIIGPALVSAASPTLQYPVTKVGVFPVGRGIMIPEQTAFSWTMDFGATLVTIAAPIYLRLSMVGQWYRPVS
jgi:hypothetical protein